MSEKKLQIIKEKLGVLLVSIYIYQAGKRQLPVFIMESIDFVILDQVKKFFEKEQFIILTMDDIMNGKDIFPLKFLLMKKNSHLAYGKDVFEDMKFDKSDLRI